MIREALNRLFFIREGEVRVTLLMQLYIFLVITVLLIVKPTVNALFLSGLGARELPYAYMLTALSAVVGFYFYNRAVVRFSLRTIIYSSLGIFSALFLLLTVMIHQDSLSPVSLYVFYITVALFAVLTTSQFWLFANMVYNTREAKRLFGFIGAGAISGGITGGYLTSIISGAYGNKAAILVAALLLLCCIPILGAVWHIRVRKIHRNVVRSRKEDSQTEEPAYKLVLGSKHLRNLAGIVAISVIVAKLVDFQFSDFANRSIPDPDELASFFGFWFSTFNVLALLIQLFLTSHILDRLGVASSLLLLPLALALGSLLFLVFPALWVLLLLKGTDGSFKQSVNKAAMELSIMPVSQQIKNRAKSFIDVVVDSIAAGAAGLLLYFVLREMELATRYVTILILFFLFTWIILIYKLREAYFESFRRNLKSSLPAFGKEDRKGAATLRHARQILDKGTEDEILNLLKYLGDYHLKSLKPHLLKLLRHESPKVKIEVLRLLRGYQKGTATEQVKNLLKDPETGVVIEAMQYLMDHSFLNDESMFREYLDHRDRNISSAALLCLARAGRNNKKLANRFQLEERLAERLSKVAEIGWSGTDKGSWISLIRSIGHANYDTYHDYIAGQFESTDKEVLREAIYAAGLTRAMRFVPNFLALLEKKSLRKPAMNALRNYGEDISKTLLEWEKQELLPEKVRPFIAKVLGDIPSKNSVRALLRLLDSPSVRTRLAAAKELEQFKYENDGIRIPRGSLQKRLRTECRYYRDCLEGIQHFHYKLNEVQAPGHTSPNELIMAREEFLILLKEQAGKSFECIFSLLSLYYDRSDIEVVFLGLQSEKEDTVNNALEFLDNLLTGRLKRNIIPLLEFGAMEKFNYDQLPAEETGARRNLMQRLMLRRGKRSKIAGLRLMAAEMLPEYTPIVKKLSRHKSQEVRDLANSILG